MPVREPIAIVGIGCRLPGGIDTPEKFWEILSEGKEVVTDIPSERWDIDFHFDSDPKRPLTQHVRRGGFLENIDYFDPGFFGITPREAICLDPQQRMLLEVAWRSMEDGGQPVELLRGRPVGVFIGISSADYSSLLWASKEDYATPDNEPFILPGNTGCIAANRISYFLDLKGPSFTVDTACSSSLVAVHLACESLWRGESELAIAGGVQALIHPGIQMSFCKAGLLSPDGRCKSFDADANGYVRSEGAGVVLLKPLSDAIRCRDQIHAVIRGSAVNSDGRSQGIAAPSQRSQAACIRDAFQKAGIDPVDTQYVEAHGTGTRQGDPIELRALGSVVGSKRSREQPCRVGSVKTNLGHGETVAGITGLIKAALCIREGKLPPSLHFCSPNPSVNLFDLGLQVQSSLEAFPQPLAPLVVGVSSFGFGGTNSHVVLSDSPQPELHNKEDISVEPPLNILCLSARSKPALNELIQRYGEFITKNPQLNLNDICASTNIGRSSFPYRFIAVAADFDDLIAQLEGKVAPAWRGELSLSLKENHSIASFPKELQLGLIATEGRDKLEALAIAIGKGYKVDWNLFYSQFPHKWIALPGHPFFRQRYWWSRIEDKSSITSLWLDHLDKNPSKERGLTNDHSLAKLQKLNLPGAVEHYQGFLDSSKYFDLTDHRIRDVVVFPAAGYLALALKLQQESCQLLKLRSFQLNKPLKASGKSTQFHALLDQGRLQFFSNDSAQDEWKCHGQLLVVCGENIAFESIPSIPPRSRDSQSIDIKAFYKGLGKIGLNYGTFYQSITSLEAIPGQSWAEIVRQGKAPDRCLIDGCFQTVAACVDGSLANSQLFLPVGLDEINLSKWPLPDQFQCHAALRTLEGNESTLVADLILDSNGESFGQIIGLKLRRLTRSLIDLLFPPKEVLFDGPDLFQTSWTSFQNDSENLPFSTDQKICLLGMNKSRATGLSDWANSKNLEFQTLENEADLDFESAMVVYWPDTSHGEPEFAVNKLLQLIQHLNIHQVKSFLLILEGDGPVNSSMTSFMRTTSLEIPSCPFTVLHLPKELENKLEVDSWNQIWSSVEKTSELRWSDGELQIPQLTHMDDERFRIATHGIGRLEDLHKKRVVETSLLPNEVEIAVESTGLNFRDVLNALGLLKEHVASLGIEDEKNLPFGGEAVGRVIALGSNVDSSLMGRRVIASLTVGSLASHVIANSDFCVPLPNGMTIEEGASFTTAFLTAIYALNNLAKLKPDEFVLIHAAAGGVGQAALQVAKRVGARILATASAPKQSALLLQGVEAVYDSRSIEFADQVLDHTNGRGVDVVINSLKGEWVEASFRSLVKGGRFIELGKIDVWSKPEAFRRRPDVNYLPFDLLDVAAAHPKILRSLLIQLVKDFERGLFQPLPLEVWPLEKCEDAFRYMAQARHIGKVVINQPNKAEPIAISSNATYLVTGAFGGIGKKLISWLAQKGASSLILVSRSANSPGASAFKILAELEEAGVNCTCISYDLSTSRFESTRTEDSLVQTIKSLPKDKPLRGIFHAAGVLNDTSFSNLNSDILNFVMAPKLEGWRHIEKLVGKTSKLEFIIGFSSVAALLGSPGQVAYAAANGAMEGYCNPNESRPVRLSIQWGPWHGDGMASGLERRFERVGIRMIESSKALNVLEKLLYRGKGGVVSVLDNDWEKLSSQASPRQHSWFSTLLKNSGPSPSEKLWKKLEHRTEVERQLFLMEELRKLLISVMAAEVDEESFDSSSIDSSDSLFDLGLDSLMAVEFASIVQAELGIRLDLDAFSEDPSLDGLATVSLRQITPHTNQYFNDGLDLSKEARLDSRWTCPSTSKEEAPGKKILITGSSGFLGAYLLAGQLRRWPDIRVNCLVRATSKEHGMERIKSNLCRFDLWDSVWEKRLEPVIGDLSLPSFGLDSETFSGLARDLGGILHNGAQLSQMAPYAQLSATNVGGTKEVLRLAALDNPICVEFISSVSVFESAAYRNRELLEDQDLNNWKGIHIGYSQTKWVSERLVLEAGKAGLPVSVYRPPLIGGHSKTGYWNQGDLLQRLLQGCLVLGKVPQLEWELDLVPVDYVSDAVSALAWSSEAKGRCFHLQHPRPLMLNDLLNQLLSEGEALEQVPMEQWLHAIDSHPKNPLYPLRTFFKKRWGREQLTYPELNALGVRARPSCRITQSILESMNVHCPDFQDLIKPWARTLLGSSSPSVT
ncbi:thioester reductase domain-containing protein [Prochlorococcus sp. MIT 1307]|uniref:thioester reductase domain-containing protein n=1 Tax=Prochlorococcus sp. MIT 1307 TaxID=3096219 RepID=UPI002A75FE65|nr:thioester reductase domain-containing protein [Prochlorococcus sp. MIT 1307]